MPSPFTRLVRFTTPSGETYYGEAGARDPGADDELRGRRVRIFEGGAPWDEGFALSEREEEISEVRGHSGWQWAILEIRFCGSRHANDISGAVSDREHAHLPVRRAKLPDACSRGRGA
jgi:hypothetical protein